MIPVLEDLATGVLSSGPLPPEDVYEFLIDRISAWERGLMLERLPELIGGDRHPISFRRVGDEWVPARSADVALWDGLVATAALDGHRVVGQWKAESGTTDRREAVIWIERTTEKLTR